MTESIKNLVSEFNPTHVNVDVIGMTTTPRFIDSKVTIEKTYDETFQTIKKLENEYDIFIIACHLDPKLEELRKETSKIVMGICESSLLYSKMLGKRFSIIGSSNKTVELKTELVNRYGVTSELDYVGYPEESLKGDLKDKLLFASKEAKNNYNSDAIVLGCAGFVGIDSYIEQELGIEVIDGVYAALIVADGYAKYHKYKNKN